VSAVPQGLRVDAWEVDVLVAAPEDIVAALGAERGTAVPATGQQVTSAQPGEK
jgi:hypothetical protein